MQFVFICTCQS